MKCTSCKRPLAKATVSISTKDGFEAYGPKCAAKAGLIATSVQARAPALSGRWRARVKDPNQTELEFNP